MSPKAIQEEMRSLMENPELFRKFVDAFPYPMEFYAPDGVLMLSNQAFLREFRVPFSAFVVGRVNIFNLPLIEKYGLTGRVKALFAGASESDFIADIPAPVHFVKNHNGVFSDSVESCFMDISGFPLKDGTDRVVCVIFIYNIKKKTSERSEVTAAKKYIEAHWIDEFNAAAVAGAVGLSKSHFTRLFKTYVGKTPHEYYISVKMERLKEHLLNADSSIENAFSSCGIEYHGYYARLFKKETGMTPSRYRGKYLKENNG